MKRMTDSCVDAIESLKSWREDVKQTMEIELKTEHLNEHYI